MEEMMNTLRDSVWMNDIRMPSQPTAHADSAISEGPPTHFCDDETVETPESPVFLRNGMETVVPFHQYVAPVAEEQGRKRKREEFESSTLGKAPFNTDSANFIANEESRRRKKVRRQAPSSLYDQLLVQLEHLKNELKLINERMKETKRKCNDELECLVLIKEDNEEVNRGLEAEVCAAKERMKAVIAAHKLKGEEEHWLMDIDDDACSPEVSDAETDTSKSEVVLNFRFDNYFGQTNITANEKTKILFSEYSEENVVDMIF
jgi:membrane-associated HD superfamily phosphohydrolase